MISREAALANAITSKNSQNAIKILKEDGHNIKLDDELTLAGFEGETWVFLAARFGLVDVVEKLIAANVDFAAPIIRGSFKGLTAMAIAVMSNHPDVIEYLSQAGVDLNQEVVHATYQNVPMVLLGILTGSTAAVIRLVELGADHITRLMAGSFRGRTPLSVATQLGRHAIVEFFLKDGVVCDEKSTRNDDYSSFFQSVENLNKDQQAARLEMRRLFNEAKQFLEDSVNVIKDVADVHCQWSRETGVYCLKFVANTPKVDRLLRFATIFEIETLDDVNNDRSDHAFYIAKPGVELLVTMLDKNYAFFDRFTHLYESINDLCGGSFIDHRFINADMIINANDAGYAIFQPLLDQGEEADIGVYHVSLKKLLALESDEYQEIVAEVQENHAAFFDTAGKEREAARADFFRKLYASASSGFVFTVESMLKNPDIKFDINAPIPTDLADGRTLICVAAEHGRANVIEMLISRKADFKSPCLQGSLAGMTPLAVAAAAGKANAVRVLISHGADYTSCLDAPAMKGKRPLDLAITERRKSVLNVLFDHDVHYTRRQLTTDKEDAFARELFKDHMQTNKPVIESLARSARTANVSNMFFCSHDGICHLGLPIHEEASIILKSFAEMFDFKFHEDAGSKSYLLRRCDAFRLDEFLRQEVTKWNNFKYALMELIKLNKSKKMPFVTFANGYMYINANSKALIKALSPLVEAEKLKKTDAGFNKKLDYFFGDFASSKGLIDEIGKIDAETTLYLNNIAQARNNLIAAFKLVMNSEEAVTLTSGFLYVTASGRALGIIKSVLNRLGFVETVPAQFKLIMTRENAELCAKYDAEICRKVLQQRDSQLVAFSNLASRFGKHSKLKYTDEISINFADEANAEQFATVVKDVKREGTKIVCGYDVPYKMNAATRAEYEACALNKVIVTKFDTKQALIKLLLPLVEVLNVAAEDKISASQKDPRLCALINYLAIPQLICSENMINIALTDVVKLDESQFAIWEKAAESALRKLEVMDKLICTIKSGHDGKKRFKATGIVFAMQQDHGLKRHDGSKCLLSLMLAYVENAVDANNRFIVPYTNIFNLTDAELEEVQQHFREDSQAEQARRKKIEDDLAEERKAAQRDKAKVSSPLSQHAYALNAASNVVRHNKSTANTSGKHKGKVVPKEKSKQPASPNRDKSPVTALAAVRKPEQVKSLQIEKLPQAVRATSAEVLLTLNATKIGDDSIDTKARKMIVVSDDQYIGLIRAPETGNFFRQFRGEVRFSTQNEWVNHIHNMLERIHHFLDQYEINFFNHEMVADLPMLVRSLRLVINELGELDESLIAELNLSEPVKLFIRDECRTFTGDSKEQVLKTARLGRDIFLLENMRLASPRY